MRDQPDIVPVNDPAYPSKVGIDIPNNWNPPNIIFIIADDLGRADIGCYGGETIPTPNLDRLAAEGMRFTDCYGGHPVCAPSRDALMTGRHTGHTTLRRNMSDNGVGGSRIVDNGPLQHRVGLNRDDVTVAEILSEAGYTTGGMGKWGLGEPGTDAVPTRKGFDTWFGYLNQRRAFSHYPPYLWNDETRIDYPGNSHGLYSESDEGPYSHDIIEDHAIEFIQDHTDSAEPFFAYLPFTLPHSELVVPEYEDFVSDDWSDDEKAYASMVSRFDQAVGRVLDLLEVNSIDDETVVFVTVDHGASEEPEEPFSSTGPLTGYKNDLYEGGIRVPMLVRWPGTVPPGEVCEDPWYFADIFPTLAEIGGLSQPSLSGDVDGISVLPTLLGDKQEGLRNRYLYWEDPKTGGDVDLEQAARFDDWKAYRADRGSEIELYDLSQDEEENVDVSDKHPEIVGKFERFFADSHTESPYWPTW